MHPPGPAPPDHSKRPRRDIPHILSVPRGFGGRPLSLRDKSRILKGKRMRAEPVVRLRAPPLLKPKPLAEGESTARGNLRSLMATRKLNAGSLKKMELRKRRQSSPNPDGNTTKPSRRSNDRVKEQGETQRSLSTHRYAGCYSASLLLVYVSNIHNVLQWRGNRNIREHKCECQFLAEDALCSNEITSQSHAYPVLHL